MARHLDDHVAEWLRNGLQNRLRRFNSGRGLHMKDVYLICGVPGSGKSWVCERLQDQFTYIPHDQYKNKALHELMILQTAQHSPVITECPFGERELKAKLELHGCKVHPYFVIIDADTAKRRYEARDHKPYPSTFYARAKTVEQRAKDWNSPYGTSQFILDILMRITPTHSTGTSHGT